MRDFSSFVGGDDLVKLTESFQAHQDHERLIEFRTRGRRGVTWRFVKRDVQVHTVTSTFSEAMRRHRGAPEDFDGVAELWWNSVDDFARAGATKEGRDAGRRLLEDERRFIDLARSPIWFGEEHALVDQARG